MSTTMNSRSITDYILKLEKLSGEQAERIRELTLNEIEIKKESRTKIEQLKELYQKSEEERVATLEKLNSKILDESIQRVGSVLNEASLYDTTARTKTHTLNKEIAEHLRELGR